MATKAHANGPTLTAAGPARGPAFVETSKNARTDADRSAPLHGEGNKGRARARKRERERREEGGGSSV